MAGGAIDQIDILRNGRLWHRISPAITPAPIDPDGDEILLFLELGWGARGSRHDWDVALTLDGGRIHAVEPRLRGPEIVSPLEGSDSGHSLPRIGLEGDAVTLSVTAEANPNNTTPAMQGMMLRARLPSEAVVEARLGDRQIRIPAARLYEGAKSGNLGPIDSPAWRIHQLPRPQDWQWAGQVPLGALSAGETIYLRLRQVSGQMAWTSPIFVR